MYKTALLFTAIFITGCSTVDDIRYGKKSTEPKPTEVLISTGNHYTMRGASEIALEKAQDFCKHWRAVPAIISQEDTRTNNYQTTLKYKCY